MTNQTIARETAEKLYPIAGQTYETLGLQLCDRKTRNECREETMAELTTLILTALTRVEDRNRARLEAAEEVVRALEGMVGRYTSLVESGDAGNWNAEEELPVIAARSALARWTAAQGETTHPLQAVIDSKPTPPNIARAINESLVPEPASRAVRITAETPFPCYLWDTVGRYRSDASPGWVRFVERPNAAVLSYMSHAHPDQPTPPTCRPTTREQQ